MILTFVGCTNARWMVKDTDSVDQDDYELLSEKEFPDVDQPPTPEDPILHLQFKSRQQYEYAEKVLIARHVQDYKVRPFFFTLGVMGAATAFYLANSNAIQSIDGQLETVTLNTVGGLLAISTIFNFKPVGEPRPTGEERFLRASGTRIYSDTTSINTTRQDSAAISFYYGDQPVFENQVYNISSGTIDLNMGVELNDLGITETDPDSVYINVGYSDSTYSFSYPLTSVLRPFAKIETPVTELRNSPEESAENVLAELVEGSQLQIIEESGEQWYKVLYGISESYIAQNDASLVWRTSDFAQKNQVVTVPSVPFGKIDVENNIPVLNNLNQNGVGLLVGIEDYNGDYEPRNYTDRDLQLMETYLNNALGYPDYHIHRMFNIDDRQPVDSLLTLLQQRSSQETEVFVYLSGYGEVRESENSYEPLLLLDTQNPDQGLINLIDLYRTIANLPAQKTVIVNNIDFSRSFAELSQNSDLPIQAFRQSLYNTAITLSSDHPGLAILFSSELDQRNHLYLGNGNEDKKHHIFPYYFAKALQQRTSQLGDLFRYLQRNVSYTARKLHNEPEDPVLFGDESIDLAGE